MSDESDTRLAERVAILETKVDDIKEIKDKLDELLLLKAKGTGALWLVSLIVGSGILGLIATVMALFNRPHL
jgi:hypothetical protein